MRNSNKLWTEAEKQILIEQYGSVNINTIVQKVHRSEKAIVIMASRLGLGLQRNGELLRPKDVAELFGVHRSTVTQSWIKKHGLKVNKIKFGSESTVCELLIDPKDLIKWMKNNQNMYSTLNLEKNILGKEDNWLKDKREADRKATSRYRRWTSEEKQRLLMYYRRGFKIKEIAERLNRTENSCMGMKRELFK